MSKTLCIHPDDPSTVMLKWVFKNKDWDVVENTDEISKDELRKMIEDHDRIIMLGHGTPSGLLNIGFRGYVIDDSFADLLRTKETASIWCNSDRFFKRNNIGGFHTGMIISECSEEWYVLGKCPLNKQEIYDNMIEFSEICAVALDMEPEAGHNYVLKHYNHDDPVTQFNRKNIIVT